MTNDASIKVHHVTRVEGHGDIIAEIQDGQLVRVGFAIVEAPRLFEAFLRGQRYEEVTHMASRICGICAVSHKCAALKATEVALNVKISEQTRLLRRLSFHGEVISSHVLHIYFLAGPDFMGIPSVFPLVKTNPDAVRRAMRMKQLGYDLSAVVAGRHTHPVAMKVGGFSFVHAEQKLAEIRERVAVALEDLKATVEMFKGINIPQFERETEYVSLRHPEHYAFYDGDIYSSEGETVSPSRYREVITEYVVPHSTAKHARWNRPEYMVGALARVNNNFDQLSPVAKTAARDLGLTVPCFNPFMITIGQIVEYAHCLEESMEILDTLLHRGITADDEMAPVHVQTGRGVGAVEAPRGILFHEYEYNAGGNCVTANHVIPTAQNLANLEADMRAFVPEIIESSEESITHQLQLLTRAYDPCISCSTHLFGVKHSQP